RGPRDPRRRAAPYTRRRHRGGAVGAVARHHHAHRRALAPDGADPEHGPDGRRAVYRAALGRRLQRARGGAHTHLRRPGRDRQVNQILDNQLSNAEKCTPPGRPSDTSARPVSTTVDIRSNDAVIAIAPENQHKICAELWQVGRDYSLKPDDTGLSFARITLV